MRILYITLLILLFTGSAFSQRNNRAELEKRREALLGEINATQNLLKNTEKDKKATLSQLRAINAQLNAREKLINNINSELMHINANISKTSQEIEVLNNNLEIFKMRYAQSVRYAYKNRASQNMLAFLFSAKNFNDGVRRMQYLKRYRDYRKEQADEIRSTQTRLNQKIEILNSDREDKGNLLQTEESQKAKIEEVSLQTNEIIRELQGKEKELMAQIKKDQQAANKIQAAIKAEIQKEIEIARKKAEEEAKRKVAELARKKAEEEAAKKRAEEAKRLAAAEKARRESNSGNVYGSGASKVTLNTGTPEPAKETELESSGDVAKGEDSKPEPAVVETPSYKL